MGLAVVAVNVAVGLVIGGARGAVCGLIVGSIGALFCGEKKR